RSRSVPEPCPCQSGPHEDQRSPSAATRSVVRWRALLGAHQPPTTLHGSAWLPVDDGHVAFVVALAGGRREVVQAVDLLGAQLHAVRGCVLLDAGDALGSGNRSDVVTLREQPGQSDLCRCCTRLGRNGLYLVDDPQVALEVLAGEARVGLAPIVVGELLGRA